MNNTAKLVKAFVQCSGITDAREISKATEVPLATIYRALNVIKLNALTGGNENIPVDENIPTRGNENIPTGENALACARSAPELFEEFKNPIVPKNSREHGTNPRANGTNPRAKRTHPRLIEPERFEEFWNVYPRKIGKGQARNAWAKAVGKVDSAQTIVDAAKAQAAALKSKGEFCPHPSTWLNGERWGDETTLNGRPKLTNEQLESMTQADVIRLMRAH